MHLIEKIYKNTREVVTREDAERLEGKSDIKSYIGIEPSGIPHIATAVMWPRKLAEIQDDIKVTVLLADWHAMINNKLHGDLDLIRKGGEILRKTFQAEGLTKADYVWASDLVDSSEYWRMFIDTAKRSTLKRVIRSLPIMGRNETDAEKDFSMYLYPIMQVTDIFYLDVDMAFGGMDQRHAHMLARDIAEKMKRKKVVSVHGFLLSSLKGNARMDNFVKMSKSDPNSAILVTDHMEDIERKINAAYCPPQQVEGNPVAEIMKYIIIPYYGKSIEIHGSNGVINLDSVENFDQAYQRGEIQPADLKHKVATILNEMVEPARRSLEGLDLSEFQ
ncbi:probable tyrosyl-tRNA synthetase [Thermoplasma acidophilum]|uniref:Tyrosine--tRNA ligase n=1 Tax=Thermoplasma acidophilum (strain ATCC 25905 / DSM 1728 / JCM 9062 / NBRC 15155 / AMRC-C165) TaxID=273075 RepID=SYY_THEAC|nr:tyrosine--tRNA ligase [Thermoplasma acidophilum]Q9HKT3.1 RecName: Full=Tyrosine--tRNA ligase; AltName: Full=Tyrosyl-tRNA synthetase; Short=TyrRS [Thermoplasma acidophilum DSM 1728]MCY0852391.1 tyrosine--tRNA ligase [Thermoplasma acidophilum]CAC11652.1 probable tyrosyl-tRNA synthetase [Thermoplasma acidophilum]